MSQAFVNVCTSRRALGRQGMTVIVVAGLGPPGYDYHSRWRASGHQADDGIVFQGWLWAARICPDQSGSVRARTGRLCERGRGPPSISASRGGPWAAVL